MPRQSLCEGNWHEPQQSRLDDFAKTRQYDNIKSAGSYVGCSVPRFAIEGGYCRDKMAETWDALIAIMAAVQAGNWPTTGAGQVPTGYSDIESALPTLEWPA